MSPESLQTIIVAVVAVLLLSQTTMLIDWVAVPLVRIRKPLGELLANACVVVGITRRRAERLDVTLAQITQMIQNRAEQTTA